MPEKTKDHAAEDTASDSNRSEGFQPASDASNESADPQSASDASPESDSAALADSDANASIELSSADPLIGTVLMKQYQVEKALGSGGWATVYRATQLSLGESVAIKVLHSGLADKESALKRIEQEAKVLSRIDNQYIVKTLDYGVSNSYPFFVMEYFDGIPLSKYLKEHGRLGTKDGIEILQQLCDGLGSAHRIGLIHRDIKPDNILLKTEPELRAKVIDFGIAKLFEDSSEDLTKSSEVLGSPPYMAPEQWSKAALDNRVDVYALGCVAYEMFSNVQAFTAQHTYEFLRLHATEDPKPFPSNLKLPRDLQRIIFKCLQKDPKDRYQNTDEINSDLAKLKAGRKLKIVLRRSRSRRSQDALVTAAALLVSGVLISAGLWSNKEKILIPYCTDENAKGDRLARIGSPLKAIPHYRNAVFWSEFLDAQDKRRLHSLRMLAKTLRSNGSFAEATALENKVYVAVGATVNPTNRVKLEEALGTSQNSRADLEHARKLACEQMKRAESTIGKHTMSYSDGLMALAMLADPSDMKVAAAQLRESIAIADDLMEPDDWSLGIRRIYLGQLLANTNQLLEAKAALSQGLAIAIKANHELEISNASLNSAIVELKLHNPKKAIELLQTSDKYYRKTVGGESPQICYIYSKALKELNQTDAYINTLHKAIRIADVQGHTLTKIQAARDLSVEYLKARRYGESRKYAELTMEYSSQYGSDNMAAQTARTVLRALDELQKK